MVVGAGKGRGKKGTVVTIGEICAVDSEGARCHHNDATETAHHQRLSLKERKEMLAAVRSVSKIDFR